MYVNEPTAPENRIRRSLTCAEQLKVSFWAKPVIVQKRKSMVNELQSADNTLIDIATWLVAGSANNEKILPKSWNNGAPGGWPTSSL